MFNLKPKQLNDEERIERLQKVFELCEIEAYPTKKLKGLLFDAIPYDTGLKTRIELMGQSGYLEKLKRSNAKETRFDGKIEQWSNTFADAYGFTRESSMKTFYLCAKALSIQLEPLRVVPSEVVQGIKTSQGNFSKKHIPSEKAESVMPQATAPTLKKKKNSYYLAAYLFFLVAVPAGLLILINASGAWENIRTLATYLSQSVVYQDGWVIGVAVATLMMSSVPWAIYRHNKVNLTLLFPLITLLIQLVCVSLYIPLPLLYEKIQLAQITALYLSFLVLMPPAIGLPRRSNRHVSVKAFFPYYLSVIVFFTAQYFVRFYL